LLAKLSHLTIVSPRHGSFSKTKHFSFDILFDNHTRFNNLLPNMVFFQAARWAAVTLTIRIAAAAGPPPTDQELPSEYRNRDISSWFVYAWIGIAAAFIIYQVAIHMNRYVRTVTCLNNDTQRYFADTSFWFGNLKRHLLDAPLFRLRHHREFKLSSAINVGTLPNRFQTIFLTLFVAMNVTLAVWGIDYSTKEIVWATQLRNRTGYLATINMVPLFIMAGRNNPLIVWCGISFDTFNLMHRWFGRLAILEGLVHFLCWIIPKVHTAGWSVVKASMGHSNFIITGTIVSMPSHTYRQRLIY